MDLNSFPEEETKQLQGQVVRGRDRETSSLGSGRLRGRSRESSSLMKLSTGVGVARAVGVAVYQTLGVKS